MEKFLDNAANAIYSKCIKFMCKYKLSGRYAKLGNMLIGLNPGKKKEELLREYFADKIKKVMICFFVAVFLIVAIYLGSLNESIIDKEGRLTRRNYCSTSYDAKLIAETESDDYEIDVTVKERIYSVEETDKMADELFKEMESILKGENTSLMHVTQKLNTVTSVEGYPFSIRWESMDYKYLHEDGKIMHEEIDDEGAEVQLMCILTYEKRTYDHLYDIKLFQEMITPQKEEINKIIETIRLEQDRTENDEYLKLPESVEGKDIVWKEASKPTSTIMAILAVFALIGIWWGLDNDLAKKYEKRDQALRLEYSEFVSKLQLLISSGMTLRGAFERMGIDYRLALKEGHGKKYVYEELLVCLKRLKDGASESDVYILFGNRCGQIAYKKLMTLLTQNLKKGTGKMVQALSIETKTAFEEQKQIARRMGDEAQTKLLFPMIIMLSIVMVIIMIPAYFSFGA